MTVSYRWTCGDWYCEVSSNSGRYLNDSQKIDFPFNTEDFGRDESAELKAALREAFPSAEVVAGEDDF